MEKQTPYSREVIDLKFKEVHKRFDAQDKTLEDILLRVTYTNGKVKKIIIALVLLFGIAIGFAGQETLPLLIKLLV